MLVASRDLDRTELARANRALKPLGVRLQRPRGAHATALAILQEGRCIPALKEFTWRGQEGHRAKVIGSTGEVRDVWIALDGSATCSCDCPGKNRCSHAKAARMACGHRAEEED